MASLPLIVKYLLVFFVSMVPIVELRGAIPIAESLGLNIFLYYPIAIIGNMLPVPIIYLFARKVLEWGKDKKLIGKYVKNWKYLNFIKKIYDGKKDSIIFKNKNDFIQYALKNNKMLSISCSKWLNIRNMKLIKFENNELTCQFINQIGERKKIYKLTLDKIDLIDFDSLELKTYEKLL